MSKHKIAQSNLKTSLYFAGGITVGAVGIGLGVALPVYFEIQKSLQEGIKQFAELSQYMSQLVNKLGLPADASFEQKLAHGYEAVYSPDGGTKIFKEINGERVLVMNTNADGTVSTAAEFSGVEALTMMDAISTAKTAFSNESDAMESILAEYGPVVDDMSYQIEAAVTGQDIVALKMRDELADIPANPDTTYETNWRKDNAALIARVTNAASLSFKDLQVEVAKLKTADAIDEFNKRQQAADASFKPVSAVVDDSVLKAAQAAKDAAAKQAELDAARAANALSAAQAAELEQQRIKQEEDLKNAQQKLVVVQQAAAQQTAQAAQQAAVSNQNQVMVAASSSTGGGVNAQFLATMTSTAPKWIPLFAATFGNADSTKLNAQGKPMIAARNESVTMRTGIKSQLLANGMSLSSFDAMKEKIMALIGLEHYTAEGTWNSSISSITDAHTGTHVSVTKKITTVTPILNTFSSRGAEYTRMLILSIKVKDLLTDKDEEFILIGRPSTKVSYDLTRFDIIGATAIGSEPAYVGNFENFKSSITQLALTANSQDLDDELRQKALGLLDRELKARKPSLVAADNVDWEGNPVSSIPVTSYPNAYESIANFIKTFVNIEPDPIKKHIYSGVYMSLFDAYFTAGKTVIFSPDKLVELFDKAFELDGSYTTSPLVDPNNLTQNPVALATPSVKRLSDGSSTRPAAKYIVDRLSEISQKNNTQQTLDINAMLDAFKVNEPLIEQIGITKQMNSGSYRIAEAQKTIANVGVFYDGGFTSHLTQITNHASFAQLNQLLPSFTEQIIEAIKLDPTINISEYVDQVIFVASLNLQGDALTKFKTLMSKPAYLEHIKQIMSHPLISQFKSLIPNYVDQVIEAIKLDPTINISEYVDQVIFVASLNLQGDALTKFKTLMSKPVYLEHIKQIESIVKDTNWMPDGKTPADETARKAAMLNFFNVHFEIVKEQIISTDADITTRFKELVRYNSKGLDISQPVIKDRVVAAEAVAKDLDAIQGLDATNKETIQTSVETIIKDPSTSVLSKEEFATIMEYTQTVFKLFSNPAEATSQLQKVLVPAKLVANNHELVGRIKTLNTWVKAINKPNITLDDIKQYAWTLGVIHQDMATRPINVITGAVLNNVDPQHPQVIYVQHGDPQNVFSLIRGASTTSEAKLANGIPGVQWSSSAAMDDKGNIYSTPIKDDDPASIDVYSNVYTPGTSGNLGTYADAVKTSYAMTGTFSAASKTIRNMRNLVSIGKWLITMEAQADTGNTMILDTENHVGEYQNIDIPAGYTTSYAFTSFKAGNANYLAIPIARATDAATGVTADAKLLIYQVLSSGKLLKNSEISINAAVGSGTFDYNNQNKLASFYSGVASGEETNHVVPIFLQGIDGSLSTIGIDMTSGVGVLSQTSSAVIISKEKAVTLWNTGQAAGADIQARGIAYNSATHEITMLAVFGSTGGAIYIPNQTDNLVNIYAELLTH